MDAASICFSESSFYTIIGLVGIIFVMLIFQFITERDHYKFLYENAAKKPQKNVEIKTNDDMDALVNPLRPPFRKNVLLQQQPSTSLRGINIPTRGEYSSWHQVGIIRQKVVTDPEQMMPLFGRRIDQNRWEYYTTNHLNTSLKIPLEQTNEFMDDDEITVPGYSGLFVIEMYDYDKPRYIPYV